MRKTFTLIVLLSISCTCFGVNKPAATDSAKKDTLTTLARAFGQRYITDKKAALQQALGKGWIIKDKFKNGKLIVLQGVDERGFPVYFATNENIISAATTQTNKLQPGGSLGLNLSGSSSYLVNKLAMFDGGSVYTLHQEFAGKTITNNDADSVNDHATHVAGTLIAKGVYPPAKGMAFGATTLQAYDFNNDLTKIASAAPGLLISNHSYGYVDGWNYNSTQSRWEWYGLPGDSVDYDFGFYKSYTQSLDQIAFSSPKYLIVRSAGNNRDENGPPIGSIYYGFVSRTDGTIVNQGPRPAGISNNNGYDIIPSSATAKNIITVGAVDPLPYGPSSSTDIQISTFSDWGPTDDGRIKPDICGNGVNVLSTGIVSAGAYLTLSGTSMSSPNVAGSLLLLQEYYAQKNGGNFMMAATLKGLACHTAFDAGRPGPDYVYGWGLLDMASAAQAITDNGTKSLIAEKNLPQGQMQTVNVTASGNGKFAATITWTDPPGTPTAGTTINDRTPKLVNDLDITVTDGTNTFYPWVLDPDHPAANATTGNNIRDNIEQVYVAGAVPGRAYTITVSHKGTLTNGSQNYSLIVTGIGGTAYCASAPTSNADSKINKVTFADINNTPPPGCTQYSDYTNLTAHLEPGKTYPLSIAAGTCGANFNKIAKVYIDWNGNGSFTDAGDLVATSAVISATGSYNTNITVPTTVVPGNYTLMRIVLQETSNAATINPCGSYGKGETQDYRIYFTKPLIDVGVIAINNPADTGACPSAISPVSVRIKNFGSQAVSGIPVTVKLTSANTGVITTLAETYNGSLSPLQEADFYFSGTFNANPGDTYSVSASTQLATDLITANNQISASVLINNAPVVTGLSALYCTNTQTYNLNGTADGTLFWYKTATDTIPFTYGQPVNTTQAPVNGNYYAGLNNFSGYVGPANKEVFSGGGYNQFTPAIYVYTQAPVILKSARLYIGNSGTLTFTVTNINSTIVSATTLNVTATRSNPAPGAQNDDLTDKGQIYNLNLLLPAAGKYTIAISYPDTATLYRNNAGISSYPFTSKGVFSITGNSAVSTTNAADTTAYRNYYYYFYNLLVQSTGCPSAGLTALALSTPAITLSGQSLVAIANGNYQWYLNGTVITGATNQIYTPNRSGNYQVGFTGTGGCISLSAQFSFVLPATGNGYGSDISLAIFPVPANKELNIAFNATANEQFVITLYDAVGRQVYKSNTAIQAGPYNTVINSGNFASGAYIIKLDIGNKTYTRKISITN